MLKCTEKVWPELQPEVVAPVSNQSGAIVVEDPIESWLERLAAGDMSAAESLWRHFFTRLQAYAAKRLRQLPPGSADADDIAASVFKGLCRMVDRDSVPAVTDAEHLWPLLATIAARKVAKQVRRVRPGQARQQIRESDLASLGVDPDDVLVLGRALGRKPSPELAVRGPNGSSTWNGPHWKKW